MNFSYASIVFLPILSATDLTIFKSISNRRNTLNNQRETA